jgi:molybdate transport system substrate-binding protein
MIVIVLGVLGGVAHAQSDAVEVTLCAPAGIREPMEKVLSAFETKTHFVVKATFGPESELRKQVLTGESFDVPVLPAPNSDLLSAGIVSQGSQKVVVSELIGVAVKKNGIKPDLSSQEAVKSALLSANAIAAGGAAVNEVIDGTVKRLGIAEQVQKKVRRARTGAEAMQLAASGDVDFGITFLNAMKDPGVDIVGPLPEDVAPPVVLVAFASSHAKNAKATDALLGYLSSGDAASIFSEYRLKPAH